MRMPAQLIRPLRVEQQVESIGHVSSHRTPRITVEAVENAGQVSPPSGLACVCLVVEVGT
jgi:hypothetical protein